MASLSAEEADLGGALDRLASLGHVELAVDRWRARSSPCFARRRVASAISGSRDGSGGTGAVEAPPASVAGRPSSRTAHSTRPGFGTPPPDRRARRDPVGEAGCPRPREAGGERSMWSFSAQCTFASWRRARTATYGIAEVQRGACSHRASDTVGGPLEVSLGEARAVPLRRKRARRRSSRPFRWRRSLRARSERVRPPRPIARRPS